MIEVDAITGGTSGSYTFSEWKAEEYLCHNWNLLCEALNEFSYGDMGKLLEKGPEACDVAIRCYLLREAINIADDELREYYDSEEGA